MRSVFSLIKALHRLVDPYCLIIAIGVAQNVLPQRLGWLILVYITHTRGRFINGINSWSILSVPLSLFPLFRMTLRINGPLVPPLPILP